jgi:hypothetical protein
METIVRVIGNLLGILGFGLLIVGCVLFVVLFGGLLIVGCVLFVVLFVGLSTVKG